MNHDVHYLVVKDKDKKEIIYMEYDKLEGMDITPKKKNRFEDLIQVNKLVLIQPTLIEKLVHKKVDRHFKRLLKLVTVILDTDDDTGTALREGLNEIEKFRLEIKNNYREYMTKEELHMLAKKLTILQEELKQKIFITENIITNQKAGKLR